MLEGVVRKSTGSWYDIGVADGHIYKARIKGKFRLAGKKTTNPLAVGDRVEFRIDEQTEDAIIENILPRTNYIIRKANNLSRQEHVIAANVDQLLLLATLGLPRTSQGFIDRILVTAEAYEIPATLVFNKADLYDRQMLEIVDDYRELYEGLGYGFRLISVKKREGLDELREWMEGKTTLLTGHSGVGKSSLLNAVHPQLALKTAEISGFSLKGKHTTTFAEMHDLNKHTHLIDTPGIKEFGIVDMAKEEVCHYFPEMRALLGKCRFNNCLHVNEPGCAVLAALEDDKIDPGRYNSYLSILSNEDTHR